MSRMFLAESNWSFQLMQFCPFVTFAEAILGSELITRLFVLLAHDNRKNVKSKQVFYVSFYLRRSVYLKFLEVRILSDFWRMSERN